MYLEHANVTVERIGEAVEFLKTAFPHFKVRGNGESTADGVTRKWLHFGTDETYVALESVSTKDEGTRRPYADVGINHLGFVVKDVETIVKRLEQGGFEKNMEGEPHPFRKRVYFYDKSGIEYEFVEYLSNDPAERNSYNS